MYEQEVYDVLVRARSLVNSFNVTVRSPSVVLGMVSSYLTEGDLFSLSHVCQHWRSVLISFASPWTQISCRGVPRTISSLERCGSLPIQLRLEQPYSNAALEDVLLRENNIVSLTVEHRLDKAPPSHQLLMSSRPYLERLHLYYIQNPGNGTFLKTAMPEGWQDLPSPRELFISQYSLPIDQLEAPNLTHLALQSTGRWENLTVQKVLDMLRRSPLLETLLLGSSGIEVDEDELLSGLINYLDFPKNIAAGFRTMHWTELWGNSASSVVTAAIKHVLKRIDIDCITLAVVVDRLGTLELLVRFEGPQGSLEINAGGIDSTVLPDLFGPQGILFSIQSVRKLHIFNCHFDDSQELRAAMPNVVSISFFNCPGHLISELLAPSNTSSPPFPHLERVMFLGHESGLEGMARGRRDLGVLLKTLVIGRAPKYTEYKPLEDYEVLESLVDDLQVGCPAQVLNWGARNEIVSIWSGVTVPGKVSLRGKPKNTT